MDVSVGALLGFGAGGLLGSMVSGIRSAAQKVIGTLISEATVTGGLARAVRRELLCAGVPIPPGYGYGYRWVAYWAATPCVQLWRWGGQGQTLYWYKRRLLWCVQQGDSGIALRWLRGTFAVERFLAEVCEDQEAADIATRAKYENSRRYGRRWVSCVVGSQKLAGQALVPSKPVDEAKSAGTGRGNVAVADVELDQCQLLRGGGREDDGVEDMPRLPRLWLSVDALEVVRECRLWLDGERWFGERGIPWKRGYLLTGDPGTGKTSFVRALAYDLALPIISFDLSSLSNQEFLQGWDRVLESRPVVALLEDIDAVFEGRKSTGSGGITFEFLLNCLDGVREASGVLLFVTTNHPDRVDSALAGGGQASRPGRLDKVVRFGRICRSGREMLAARVLREYPQEAAKLVDLAGDELTPAQFQQMCCEEAERLYWKLYDGRG